MSKKTKVIIQIPCFNEEETLPITLQELPRELPGVDKVEWLIIDDGSYDDTVKIAQDMGVDHIVRHTNNQGLARAFMTGIEASLKAGADIIVNTDADNQYNAADIPALIQPILDQQAEMVIGARPIKEIEHFSNIKKFLQQFGSKIVRIASRTEVDDAPSGFRAFSRHAAIQLNVFTEYTYTLETIIQAGQKNISVRSVPIRTNKDLRASRLVKSIPSYVRRSILTIIRIFMTYRPFRLFAILGTIPFTIGVGLGIRWIFLRYVLGDMSRLHEPSLILTAILILLGAQLWIFGMVADLQAVNRKLLEDIQVRLRRMELGDSDDKISGTNT
ncbi:glycosyltransferase family 2 protein [Desulfogranum japonicum]|uniref:glycosyltransferase family 2 protein n=1 Tax=Desulfogranum japonicum TaxID=231447 RepID=UPI000421F56C|nr:glycosyltransferase family 2 protein [Desulfogranum japonicum]